LKALPVSGSFLQTHSNELSSTPKIRDVDWVCGAAMVIRDETKKQLGGGFDPNIFLYGEDEDICIEAKHLGWKVQQINIEPVIHEFGWGKHKKTSTKVATLKAQSLGVFIDKHFNKYSPSWLSMKFMLWIKKLSWGVKS
jgi:GT2 family glycosyltransferase